VLNGDPGVVQALLDHGALVNAADEEGQTPLHKVAVQGQLELTQELIARGANINAQLQVCSLPIALLDSRLLESGHLRTYVSPSPPPPLRRRVL
jgi:ankyrin repeat protein